MSTHTFSKSTRRRSSIDLAFVKDFAKLGLELIGNSPFPAECRVTMNLGDHLVKVDGLDELESLLLQLPKWQFPDDIDIVISGNMKYISYKSGSFHNFLYVSYDDAIWVDRASEKMLARVKETWATFKNSWNKPTPGKIMFFQFFVAIQLFTHGIIGLINRDTSPMPSILMLTSALMSLSAPFVNSRASKMIPYTKIDLTLVPNATLTKSI